MAHPTIQLKVLNGPDKGQELRFQSECIRLGRDPRKNDFVLTDQYVSAQHGELNWQEDELKYTDLQSRHGTSITVSLTEDGISSEQRVELHNLQQSSHYSIASNAQLLLGSTLIYLTFAPPTSNDTIEEQQVKQTLSPALGQQVHTILPFNAVDPRENVSSANYHDAPSPTSAIALDQPYVHSLASQGGVHSLENAQGIPHGPYLNESQHFLHNKTTPDDHIPSDRGLHFVTSFPRNELDTLSDPNHKEFLKPDDTAEEELNYRGFPHPEFTFEELASISMQKTLDLDRHPTQPDTVFNPAALNLKRTLQLGESLNLRQGDHRLNIVFRLSNQLNRLSLLDEMLNLIVSSTFEALPAAKFFALYRADKLSQRLKKGEGRHKLIKYVSRVRENLSDKNDELILSQSLLEKVAEKREAILFTRDTHASATVSIIEGEIWSCLCAPLIGQRSLLGVMLVDTRQEGSLFTPQDLDLFSVFASNAAFAIERTQLTEEIVNMFEGFVGASVSAIEARDPTTAGHSERVATYALSLAETVNQIQTGPLYHCNFTKDELVELRYAALLHDIGKVGVREAVLNKACRITDERMNLIKQRFDCLSAEYQLFLTERWLQELKEHKKTPSDDGLQLLLEDAKGLTRELQSMAEWLEKIRKIERLMPEDIERIQQIAARKIVLGQDRMVSLLQPDEVKNLAIERGTLNDQEWKDMRSHAALSQAYLEKIPWSSELSLVPCIAGAHHEKLDGSGYPQGLKADVLIPQIRILTIADIFDALTAWDRPYRKSISHQKAISILLEEAHTNKLDRDLVEVFAEKVVPQLEDYSEEIEVTTPQKDTEKAKPPRSISVSSPSLRPLSVKTTGHYTLFQQEKFHPSSTSESAEEKDLKTEENPSLSKS